MTLESLGLGGDGDEVDAITQVEREFGVTLPYEQAPSWETVGHVFQSLISVLPGDYAEEEIWARFTAAISLETGAEPSQVMPATRLLAIPLREKAARAFRR